MKTKVTFEKLNCDFWDLSELKEPFEKGELYHKIGSQYFQIKERTDLSLLSLSAIVGGSVYKRVEEELTVRDEVSELDNDELTFRFPVRENGKISIYHNERHAKYSIRVEVNAIHKLSEILKRHGK